MSTELADRVETWRLDDGTIEERVHLDGKLVEIRRSGPEGVAPRHAMRTPYLLDRAGS